MITLHTCHKTAARRGAADGAADGADVRAHHLSCTVGRSDWFGYFAGSGLNTSQPAVDEDSALLLAFRDGLVCCQAFIVMSRVTGTAIGGPSMTWLLFRNKCHLDCLPGMALLAPRKLLGEESPVRVGEW